MFASFIKRRWFWLFFGAVLVVIGLCLLVSPNVTCDGELMSRSDVCPVDLRSHGRREFSHYQTYEEATRIKYGVATTLAIGGAVLAAAAGWMILADRQANQPRPRGPRRRSGRGRPGRPRSRRRE